MRILNRVWGEFAKHSVSSVLKSKSKESAQLNLSAGSLFEMAPVSALRLQH